MMKNRKEYRVFCREHTDQLPIFFQDWYLDAVCRNGDWGAAIVEAKGRTVGVWPWFLKRKAGFRYLAMPLFTKFLGPWFVPGAGDHRRRIRWTRILYEQLPAVHCIKADCHYQFDNWLPLYWAGFRQTERYSYQLDLSKGLAAAESCINRNMRRNIKSARELVNLRDFDDPALFYRINQMSFDRQNEPIPYSQKDFEVHDAALRQKGQRRMYLAEDQEGRIHSVAYLIWDRQSAYYHLSGDDPSLRDSGSGILLIWEAVRYTTEELGLPVFDFEGSMMEQVGAIRRQFGAFPVPYSSVWKYHSRLYALLDWLKGNP